MRDRLEKLFRRRAGQGKTALSRLRQQDRQVSILDRWLDDTGQKSVSHLPR